jgi:hypothetical protein
MDIAEKLKEYSLNLLNIVSEYLGKNYKLAQMEKYYNKYIKKNKDFSNQYKNNKYLNKFKSIIGSFLYSELQYQWKKKVKNKKMFTIIEKFVNIFNIYIRYYDTYKTKNVRNRYTTHTHQCGYLNIICKLHRLESMPLEDCKHNIHCKFKYNVCLHNNVIYHQKCNIYYNNMWEKHKNPVTIYDNITLHF